ncbi:MAG TPA: hypothetical protein VK054_09075, partial [Beutenbergiaceae bacterium]|nr:hypothetical protein [Beutenbergiaceae bacterium]
MGFNLGDAEPDALYVGGSAVSRVMFRGEQVWPTGPPPVGYGVFSGGTVIDEGDWRYHVFSADGTLEVVEPGLADVLIVDGGGGGGSAGGGGGGAVLEVFGVEVTSDQTVTVGAGGDGDGDYEKRGKPGEPSSLGTLVQGGSAGGGGGGQGEQEGADGTVGGGGGG